MEKKKNMKTIYLVNRITKTSVPWRWSEYFNKNSKNNKINIVDIKLFVKNLKHYKREANIVHGHHIKAMSIFLLLNKRLKIKSIYTVHGSYLFLSKSNALLLKFIFKSSDKIIFVNRTLYSVLPQSYKNIIKDKYEIILNGVEVDYKYKKVDIYQKFNIDIKDKIIFHPARFVEEKNHIRIISALKPLLDKDKKLKLILAGGGKLEDNIKLHIKKLNLSDSVILIGTIERDEVYNFLEKCEIFLMPSVSEGLNIAFLEAISMKSKIVVSNIEQFTYPLEVYNLNPEQLNITFVDPLDEENIYMGISKALSKNRNLECNYQDFSLNIMMKKYDNIYYILFFV
ncbi:MAG TPA: glycosyltransferase [Campylobacterales bacterium]|nr:glycosyltransferase [Campylobacterales bacterium]